MNQPFPMPGAPVASAPAPFPSPTPPMVPSAAPVDFATKARQEIQQKVTINGVALTTPEQIAWGYTLLARRLGNKSSEPDMDKRIVGALANTTNSNLIEPGSYAECVQQAVALIPEKIRWQGHKPASAEHAQSTFDWLMAKSRSESIGFNDGDLALTMLAWLESLKAENPFELDEATRAQKTPQPPPNPISDQKTQQVAQIVPPPVAPTVPGSEPEEKEGKGEFVDKLTGYVCSSLRGLKSKVSKTHKKDWTAYCQEVGYDLETGKPATGAPVAAQAPGIGAQIPTAAPPAGPGVPPLVGQQSQAPVVAQQQLYAPQDYPAPPVGPVAQVQMPTPLSAAQVPAGVPYPIGMAPATLGVTVHPTGTMQIAPAGQHSGMVAPPAMMQAVPQLPPQQPMQQALTPTTAISSFSRAENAKLLGGEVDLVLVRLTDAGAVPLTGRVDANQLAILAQQQALQSLTSIEDMKFRKDKQIAQRLFGEMLTKHPGIFILQNGYDLILPEGFLEVIAARATSVYIAKDQGQSFTTIKFA